MKKNLLLLFTLFCTTLFAHTGAEHAHDVLKDWVISTEKAPIKASFMMLKDNIVFLEDAQNKVRKFPLATLSAADKSFVLEKQAKIQNINQKLVEKTAKKPFSLYNLLKQNAWLTVWLGVLLVFFTYLKLQKPRVKPLYLAVFMGFMLVIFGFLPKMPPPQTDPTFIDAAFIPFKPKVKTRWDNQYFYVESQGIPSHKMMAGIVSWQQQVPIPQCYIGTNAWSIPLNPIVATTPTPTATNFFKGAVAIAANGVPIFNAYNNRGEDAYLIGELDNYGGHCGRADDYHYHIAPLSLDSVNAAILPIAFALDGFAVYAAKEPDGTNMQTLDINHGHYFNGVYHYHGTMTYPYMIGNMVGVVTKDATDQIVPQASASPVRPALTALRGAAITDCVPNATNNGYNLTYTLNNQTNNVNYSWTPNGVYTYNFVSPTGTTTSTYNGFRQCTLSTATTDFSLSDYAAIYPNPTKGGFSLKLDSPFDINDVKSMAIYDVQGRLIYQNMGYKPFYELNSIAQGTYIVKIQFSKNTVFKKLIIN